MPLLLPCPFCGNGMESFAGMIEDAFARGENTFGVNCDCGATGPLASTMQAAVDAWNKRSVA